MIKNLSNQLNTLRACHIDPLLLIGHCWVSAILSSWSVPLSWEEEIHQQNSWLNYVILESLITMKEQTGEGERVCLFCVESCGWCGGEDLCQVVREGLLSEPGSKGDCERILENLGSVYAGCTVSPSGRHIPAVWKPQTGIRDSKCELTGMGSAMRAHGLLTFIFSELDRWKDFPRVL